MNGIRSFELMEDLAPSSSAKAVLLKWNGQHYVRSTDVVELHEFVQTHGARGDRGYAFKSPESGLWEALSGLYQQVPAFSGM